MERNLISTDEIITQLNKAFSELDNSRANEMEAARQLLTTKQQHLRKEKERLTAKYGREDRKVQEITARIMYNEEVFQAMDVEIARAKINTMPFEVTSWRVHGLVLDAEGKPQEGMTIYLADEKQQSIQGTEYECSGPEGYYAVTLDKDLVKKYKGVKLYLVAARKERKKPFVVAQPLQALAGTIDYVDIILSDESCDPPRNMVQNDGPTHEEK